MRWNVREGKEEKKREEREEREGQGKRKGRIRD